MILTVTVVVSNVESTSTSCHTFVRSPIWIGADPSCEICLVGTGANRGGIFFGPGVLEYWDLALDGQSYFDGQPVRARAAVPLSAPGALAFGPYRLTVTMEPGVAASGFSEATLLPEEATEVMPAFRPALSHRRRFNLASMRTEALAVRTFDFAMALATIVVEVRDSLVFPAPSILGTLAGVDEIVDYLLGADCPDRFLDELAKLVVAIARRNEFAAFTAPVARA